MNSMQHRMAALALRSAALGALALSACSSNAGRAAAAVTAPPPTTTTSTARTGTIGATQVLGGFIAPLENVSISSSLSEPALRVAVVEGQRVASGALLAVFDTSDLQAELDSDVHAAQQADANATKQYYAGAQTISAGTNNVANAQSALAQAREKERLDRANLSRDAALLHEQYIAQQTYDSQLTTVQTDAAITQAAQAALANARLTSATNGTQSAGLQGATLASAREAAAQARATARQVQAQISRGMLYAPVAGIVTNRNLNPGEYPGSRTLFTIQSLATVYAQLNASAEQLTGVHVGNRVTLNAHGTTGTLTGRVNAILGEAAPGSTNFTIKVEVPNASGALLAGMAVDAAIALQPTRGTLVPRSSLANDETQIGIVASGTYHVARVHVIAENDTSAIVSGVSPGTRIVTQTSDLRDGQRVALH